MTFIKSIKVSNIKDEVVAFIDRKATELSNTSGRKVSRNEYINLILEKQLRDDLTLEDKYDLHWNVNSLLDKILKFVTVQP